MPICASIPVASVDAANAELAELGFGSPNFSVPVRSGNEAATHAALHHAGKDDAFLAALQDMSYPNLEISTVHNEPDKGGDVTFKEHVTAHALEWSDPELWFQNPVKLGDTRTFGGKTWVSLIDGVNVWQPPVGWREVVASGYPDWVQPTGGHDAYKVGDKVKFSGKNYESVIAANVWSPTAYPAGWKVIT